jgi:hypothetical protein
MTLEGNVRYVIEAVGLLVYFEYRNGCILDPWQKPIRPPKLEQLLRTTSVPLSIYHKAVLSAVDLADSLKYNDALKLKERAFRMLASARGDYWNHVSKHGCRPEPSC